MNSRHCCQPATRGRNNARQPASRWRRGGVITGHFLPGALLVMMPKCPACVAAYVAAGTGIGLSLTTATRLRASLVGLCVASLVVLIGRLLLRFQVKEGKAR